MGRPKKTGDRNKYKCMTCVLYPESQQEAIEYAQKYMPCAWALHDKDTYDDKSLADWKERNPDKAPPWQVGDLKKPHLHFVFLFPNKRALSGVAKELRVADNVLCKGENVRALYEYLYHKDDATKYRYDESIVHTHDFDAPDDDTSSYMSEKEQAQKIREMPPELTTLDQQLEWCLANDCYECFSSKYAMWRDWRSERKYLLLEKEYAETRSGYEDHAQETRDYMTSWERITDGAQTSFEDKR